jgi:hypothetical protein
VFYEFYEAPDKSAFSAYSPATGKKYQMECRGQSVVSCTGGNGAEVRFPMSAVQVYTEKDARAYAATHDVGP